MVNQAFGVIKYDPVNTHKIIQVGSLNFLGNCALLAQVALSKSGIELHSGCYGLMT